MKLIRKISNYFLPKFLKKVIVWVFIKIKHINSGIALGKNVVMTFKTEFEGRNKIYSQTNISNSYIGYGTYINSDSSLTKTSIGKFCSIASNVKVGLGRHPSKKFVSTHPAFFSIQGQAGFQFTNKQLFKEFEYISQEKKYVVKIGNDVWIGYGVTIIDGVSIGNGAIIGAGSVVTKDVEPYSINVGVPSKKIGYRFDEQDIELLEDFQWWDKKLEWIKQNYKSFQNIKEFKAKFL